MDVLKKVGMFAAGTLFGTAGIKVLTSKDAKVVVTGGLGRIISNETENVNPHQPSALLYVMVSSYYSFFPCSI